MQDAFYISLASPLCNLDSLTAEASNLRVPEVQVPDFVSQQLLIMGKALAAILSIDADPGLIDQAIRRAIADKAALVARYGGTLRSSERPEAKVAFDRIRELAKILHAKRQS